ncbi:unnamed protein product, partial [Linum tenue]
WQSWYWHFLSCTVFFWISGCRIQLSDFKWHYGVQLCHGYCGTCVVSTGRGNCPCFKEPYKDYCYAYTPPVKKPERPKPYLGLKFFPIGEMYRRRGFKILGGILLCGSPGVGKTQLAKVVAGEAAVTFFSTSGSQVVEICVGVGASRVRSLNQEARENAPSLVFTEELNVVGRERGLINGSGGQKRDATLHQLLVCLEGFEGRGEVITIASTNRQDILDPALVHPGRFDRKIYIPRPGLIGCMEILKVHASNKPMAEDVDYMAVASMTDGMVGVELANIIEVAAINMMRDGRNEITTDDFLQAAQIEERGWKKVAINEAAMAVVALNFLDFRDIEFVTISPRAGLAGLINTCRMVLQHPLSCQFAAVKLVVERVDHTEKPLDALWNCVLICLCYSWVVLIRIAVVFKAADLVEMFCPNLPLPEGWNPQGNCCSTPRTTTTVQLPTTGQLPVFDASGSLKLAPQQILAKRFVNKGNQAGMQSFAASPVGSSTSKPSFPSRPSCAPNHEAVFMDTKIHAPNSFPSSSFLPSPPQRPPTHSAGTHLLPKLHTTDYLNEDPISICAPKNESFVSSVAGIIAGNLGIGIFCLARFSSGFPGCRIQLSDFKWHYGVQLCHGYCGTCVVSTGRGNCPCFKEPYKDYCYAYTPPVKKPERPKPYLGLKFFPIGEMYRRRGFKILGGILLCGSPGVGKTHLAKVVAGEAAVTFFSTSGSQVVEICVGVGASRVRSLNQEARENAPSLVFTEELNVVGRERGLINGSGGQKRDATLHQLLVCLEGFEGRGEVITIASTNRQDILDPALVHPGRFDRKIYIPRPGLIGCMEILKVHASNKPMAEDVDYMAVASMTDGMVGVELANIIEVAAINMMRDGRNEITTDDFLQAAQIEERGWKKVAINEAAMAVVALNFLDFRDIEFVTISPRAGLAGLINTCRMVLQHPLSCQFAAVKLVVERVDHTEKPLDALWNCVLICLCYSWVVLIRIAVVFKAADLVEMFCPNLPLPEGWNPQGNCCSTPRTTTTVQLPTTGQLPVFDASGSLKLAPQQILAKRFVNKGNQAGMQ